jgi:hypothetical protein
VTIGTDVFWQGTDGLTLRIPASYSGFYHWLSAGFVGSIISVDGVVPFDSSTSWGYVDTVSSDGTTNLLLHVTWVKNIKPTSGLLYPMTYQRTDVQNVVLGTGMGAGTNPGWAKQLVAAPSAGAVAIALPAGYPYQW